MSGAGSRMGRGRLTLWYPSPGWTSATTVAAGRPVAVPPPPTQVNPASLLLQTSHLLINCF